MEKGYFIIEPWSLECELLDDDIWYAELTKVGDFLASHFPSHHDLFVNDTPWSCRAFFKSYKKECAKMNLEVIKANMQQTFINLKTLRDLLNIKLIRSETEVSHYQRILSFKPSGVYCVG
jgi:hypothetical protein